MHQQVPGSPAPSQWAPGSNDLGPQAATQARQMWAAGETDDRPVLSALRAPSLWRVTLHGENVYFRVSWATSANHVVEHIQPPSRFVVPGSVDVYAVPIDPSLPAHAEVTCTPATSGSAAVLRSRLAGAALPISPEASRFVALQASVVQVGPTGLSTSVNLTALQAVLLVAGSVLTSGGGYLEYEP